MRQRRATVGRTHAFDAERRVADGNFRGDALRQRRVVADLDFELRRATDGRSLLNLAVQERDVGWRGFVAGGFELNLSLLRQRREIGAGPIRSLKVADHDQLAAAIVFRIRSQHLGRLRNHSIDVQPLGANGRLRQFVAQRFEVLGRLLEGRTRGRSRENQVHPQTRSIAKMLGRDRPGALDGFDATI